MIKIALLLFAVVPAGLYLYFSKKRPRNLWLATGISFGLVASPISIGVLGFNVTPLIGKLLGLFGLILTLIHGFPGYFMGSAIGITNPGVVLAFPERFWVEVLNGIFWATIYGILGYTFDAQRREKAEGR
ncbi:MAG: hypothetical protein KKE17_10200 [Proteobacteria bacterium]|nr:hypothetical protein [Pseudomonadota bacterium]MBU1710362.1 hypothetical protein [Pseudomonadota bacterium]